jgi:hypothetical protein
MSSRRAASIVGTLFALALAACVALSYSLGTCTQGDTDGHMAGLILGTPLALAAVGAFWISRSLDSAAAYVQVVVTGVLALVFGVFLAPFVGSTTIAGHHLCGDAYDEFVAYGHAIDRWVPLVQLLLFLAVFVVAALPLCARRTVRE